MPLIIYLYIIVFFTGASFGSFLNALEYRLNNKKKIFLDRSICPKCGHKLGFFDLIPIFSYLFLQGKCRYCHRRISIQYPLVEFFSGLFFLLAFNKFFFQQIPQVAAIVNTIFAWIIFFLLLVIFLYDVKEYIIPDEAVYSLIFISLIYHITNIVIGQETLISFLRNFLLTGAISSSFFFFIWLISKGKWMGFGDVKLALFIGFFLGWPLTFVSLFSAFLTGAIIGLVLIGFNRKKLSSQMPFAPFLIFGFLVSLFWGAKVIYWYLNFLKI